MTGYLNWVGAWILEARNELELPGPCDSSRRRIPRRLTGDPRLLANFPAHKHRRHSPSASSSSQQTPFGPSAVEDRGIVGEQVSASAGSRHRSPISSESGRISLDTQVTMGEDAKLA